MGDELSCLFATSHYAVPVNAAQNPFRSSCFESIPFQFRDDCSLSIIIERWQSLGHRAAVVGPKGSGKTTLLEELAIYLDCIGVSAAVLRISAEKDMRNFFSSVRQLKSEVLLLDGAEQLSWPAWLLMNAILGPKRGLIATMHKQARLPVIYETSTSPELLKDLLYRLGQEGLLSDEEVQKYCEVAGGNIREVFFRLYARCAGISNSLI